MSLKEMIKNILYEYLKDSIGINDIIIENPKDRKLGDYALPCFSYAKVLHKAPNLIAEEIKTYLEEHCSFVSTVQVIGGYVNVFLNKENLAEEIIKKIRSLNTKDGDVMDVLRRVQNMNAPEPEVPDYNEREGMEYGE